MVSLPGMHCWVAGWCVSWTIQRDVRACGSCGFPCWLRLWWEPLQVAKLSYRLKFVLSTLQSEWTMTQECSSLVIRHLQLHSTHCNTVLHSGTRQWISLCRAIAHTKRMTWRHCVWNSKTDRCFIHKYPYGFLLHSSTVLGSLKLVQVNCQQWSIIL